MATFRITRHPDRHPRPSPGEPDTLLIHADRALVTVLQYGPDERRRPRRPTANHVQIVFERGALLCFAAIVHPSAIPAPDEQWPDIVELVDGDQAGFWWCSWCWGVNVPDVERVTTRFDNLNDAVVHSGWHNLLDRASGYRRGPTLSRYRDRAPR